MIMEESIFKNEISIHTLYSFIYIRLLTAIVLSQIVMQQSALYLLFPNDYSSNTPLLISDKEYKIFDLFPTRKLISFNNQEQTIRVIYLYNPTDQRRVEIVKILLNTHQVHVTSNKQPINACQIDPKWSNTRSNIMAKDQFEVRLIDIEYSHSSFVFI
jgi:hypothetical protein